MQLDGSCAAQEIDLLFSPPSIFLFPFFFISSKCHSTWRLNVHSALCIAAQEIDLLSAFFSSFSCTRRNMQRCRLQGDFRCDNYELLIRCYHFPFYNTHAYIHTGAQSGLRPIVSAPDFFSLFFFFEAVLCHILRLRYVTFGPADTHTCICFFLSLRFPQRT